MSDLLFFLDDDLIYKAKQKPWKAPKEPRPQDVFENSYTDVPVEYVPFEQAAFEAIKGKVAVFDVECFSNYFLVEFRIVETGQIIALEQDEFSRPLDSTILTWLLRNLCLIGYNSNQYDVPMCQLAATGATCMQLFKASYDIIKGDMRSYQFEKRYGLSKPTFNHIDLIEVAPLRGSLKLYAGRLGTKRMQDLPVDPLKPLTPAEKIKVKAYCNNDMESTELLFRELEPALSLRVQMSKQYGVDLRSKSDAQIAEAVIASELGKQSGIKCKRPDIPPGATYSYKVPDFLSYRTPVLQAMLETVRSARFTVGGDGYVTMPEEIGALQLAVGGCVYRMGIGGLHSSEKVAAYKADENTLLIDRDVVSFYPKIILNQKLFPQHLGRAFLVVYNTIVDRRIAAKVSGDKIVADSLKITINGSFGKLGSKWSVLYAPDLMIQVTISGQLCLLMLIEMIEDLGVPVVSANTDGIVIQCPKDRYQEVNERIKWWEALTNFETEEARYRAIYSRDVNNYVALKDDGKCKVKGTYGERGSAGNSVLSKNPENLVCNDAAIAMIEHGTPVEETVRSCKDIKRFCTLRNVTGGARKSQTYLGKTIRWYYSTEMLGEINRVTNGDKVPNSDGARPLMQLPEEFPTDVDFARYIEVANNILYDIGHTPRPPEKKYLGDLFKEESLLLWD